MKFREWLTALEAAQAPMPGQNMRLNPDSMYGGQRTMLPISKGINNRLVASVVGGIGAARKKISSETGAEPGSVPQLGELEDMRRNPIQSIYMPLQLPEDWSPEDSVLYPGKGLQNMAMKTSQNPAEDHFIWNVDKNDNISIQGVGGPSMKTKLFVYDRHAGPQSDISSYRTAVNFTQALMKVSLTSRLAPYSHLLNLENPELRDAQEMPVEADKQGQKMNTIMMCSFVFSPKTKDTRIGGNDWDDIQDRLGGKSPDNKNNAAPAMDMSKLSPQPVPATSTPQTGPIKT